MHWDLEALNRYVLMAIGLFAAFLYFGLLYAGFVEFVTRISKKGSHNKKRSGNGCAARGLRNERGAVQPGPAKRTRGA
jgi:hypothetical protein